MTPPEESQNTLCSPAPRSTKGDLAASLRGLSVLSAGSLSLSEMLIRVAHFGVQAISGADGAGLALLTPGRADIIVTTTAFVARVDAAQYGLGEGPCISAARERLTVLAGSLGGDLRWSRFGGRAARMGVHSALSLPLITPEEVVGAMTIYAHAKHAFDGNAAELGELFAVPAAIAVQNARALEDTRRLAAQLQTALDERMVIERAVGIEMSRSGVDEATARAGLIKRSQREHVKLLHVARNLVDEAVRAARAQPRSRQSHRSER